MSHEDRETKITLYQLLGITKERADEIARMVRASFSESKGPTEWIVRLAEEFQIDRQELAEAFACGWFAGKYAGVSEVFNVVQREVEVIERDRVEKNEMESKYQGLDGYA